MTRFFWIIVLSIFLSPYAFSSGENNGDWHTVGSISDKCNFIGDAKLNINYKTVKIKVLNWTWNDSSAPVKKFFKGKFKKNKTDISIASKAIGYKLLLEGKILGYDSDSGEIFDEPKIFLTFSSTSDISLYHSSSPVLSLVSSSADSITCSCSLVNSIFDFRKGYCLTHLAIVYVI